jgi:hypothetical protein
MSYLKEKYDYLDKMRHLSKIVGYTIKFQNQYNLWLMGAPRHIVEANEIDASNELFIINNPFLKQPKEI